ncbi:MAG TPA: ROK family protein [Actinocrinis sp.]|nr:ROK family protein [Actinocrinis sp.]
MLVGLAPVLLKYMPFSRSPPPRAGAGAVLGPAVGAVVDGVHGGVAVVALPGAEVEAAAVARDVRRGQQVDALGLCAGRDVLGVGDPVAGALGVEQGAVGRLAADRHRQRHRRRADVRAAGTGARDAAGAARAGGALGDRHVVGVGGLVVQLGDRAGGAGAERDLRRRFGAARGCQNIVYLRPSAGIGAGAICDGRMLLGHGGVAGEIGHVVVEPRGALCRCGNRGCLETVASPPAIADLLSRSREHPVTAADLPDLLRTADRGAARAVQDAGDAVGRALAMVPTNLETLRVGEGILAILLAGGIEPRTAGWARDALSLYVSAYALEQSLVQQQRRHQDRDQDQDQEWTLSHEELLDRFTALPAEKFPQTRRHAAELISGTGHERFEFTIGLLVSNLGPASAPRPGRAVN